MEMRGLHTHHSVANNFTNRRDIEAHQKEGSFPIAIARGQTFQHTIKRKLKCKWHPTENKNIFQIGFTNALTLGHPSSKIENFENVLHSLKKNCVSVVSYCICDIIFLSLLLYLSNVYIFLRSISFVCISRSFLLMSHRLPI